MSCRLFLHLCQFWFLPFLSLSLRIRAEETVDKFLEVNDFILIFISALKKTLELVLATIQL
jgi:hypothetical protein